MNKEVIEKMYSLRYPLLMTIQKYENRLIKEMKHLDYINITDEESEQIKGLKDELHSIKDILNYENMANSSGEQELSINSSFRNLIPTGIKLEDERIDVNNWRDLFEYAIRYFAKLDKDKFMSIVENRVNLLDKDNRNPDYRFIPELELYLIVKNKGSAEIVSVLKQLAVGFNIEVKIIVKSL